jgi:hypothetical protein
MWRLVIYYGMYFGEIQIQGRCFFTISIKYLYQMNYLRDCALRVISSYK